MRILEYGHINNPTIIFIHGFESPYQIWNDYIEHYKTKFHILVPILKNLSLLMYTLIENCK